MKITIEYLRALDGKQITKQELRELKYSHMVIKVCYIGIWFMNGYVQTYWISFSERLHAVVENIEVYVPGYDMADLEMDNF